MEQCYKAKEHTKPIGIYYNIISYKYICMRVILSLKTE